jgi:hypothetical protein
VHQDLILTPTKGAASVIVAAAVVQQGVKKATITIIMALFAVINTMDANGQISAK